MGVGMPDIVNKNTGCPAKFELGINHKYSFIQVFLKHCMGRCVSFLGP